MKLGGPGKTVEVDETKIGKRKSQKGRLVEGQWIFGMVQRDSGGMRYVAPGTTIISDCWGGYNKLEAEGFDHLTVNHSQNCVDPQSGAHTQKIEASCRAIKLRLSRGA